MRKARFYLRNKLIAASVTPFRRSSLSCLKWIRESEADHARWSAKLALLQATQAREEVTELTEAPKRTRRRSHFVPSDAAAAAAEVRIVCGVCVRDPWPLSHLLMLWLHPLHRQHRLWLRLRPSLARASSRRWWKIPPAVFKAAWQGRVEAEVFEDSLCTLLLQCFLITKGQDSISSELTVDACGFHDTECSYLRHKVPTKLACLEWPRRWDTGRDWSGSLVQQAVA